MEERKQNLSSENSQNSNKKPLDDPINLSFNSLNKSINLSDIPEIFDSCQKKQIDQQEIGKILEDEHEDDYEVTLTIPIIKKVKKNIP